MLCWDVDESVGFKGGVFEGTPTTKNVSCVDWTCFTQ